MDDDHILGGDGKSVNNKDKQELVSKNENNDEIVK